MVDYTTGESVKAVIEEAGWEKFPPTWPLAITFAILGFGVFYSLWRTRRKAAVRA